MSEVTDEDVRDSFDLSVAKKIDQFQVENPTITVHKSFRPLLTEAVLKYAEVLALDLEAFSKHAKRTVIGVDDVKLAARKNEVLAETIGKQIDEYQRKLKEDKENRKRSKG
ncbi:hypothetical protein MP638_002245 [Amoeboaphelidium occidentale]|nr:hypothetical protein MP638_002245 [Amoeboaphelidium occidentale]